MIVSNSGLPATISRWLTLNAPRVAVVVVAMAVSSSGNCQQDSSGATGSVNQNTTQSKTATKLNYPDTKTVDVSDNYHGRIVKDPYRWLEDVESDDTAAWVKAQNEVTQAYLQDLPQRETLRSRLEEFWNYERFGLPRSRTEPGSTSETAKTYFYTHNDGLQDQSILYKSPTLKESRDVLIDPNTLSEDGTVAMSGWAPSEDGKLIAYGLADGGSDWRTWKVRDVASGKDLDDVVRWVKFSSIAWTIDGKGFFYARYDEPSAGEEMTGTNENQKLYYHAIGTDQSADTLVLSRPDEPKWGFSPLVTDDGRYLVIGNWKGTEPKTQVFVKDLQDPDGEVQPLISGFDADYEWFASVGSVMYFLTDHQAPRRRVISVDADQPDRENWKEVIAQNDDVLQGVSMFGDRLFANYLQDARARVAIYDVAGPFSGTVAKDLDLPGVGSVSGFGGRQDATETFFSFTNYVTPTSIYRLDLESMDVSLWRQPSVEFPVDDFMTEQVFVTSKDGTKLPMIITRRKDSVLDASNPTLLYAYGGFNISLTPSYSPAIAGWLDAGGVYAVANLRGGGEYGRQWHEDGMRLKKQNVFDDFIASAEYLIEKKYTTSKRLGIRGGSNGGLLVGAVMAQRPELFGACLPAVGVMDMLRYHKFTIGWAWATEYGSSDEEDQIDNLLSYSPLHNLKPGTCYPPTLITTADRDDRVVPGHSFKFAAALQSAQGCDNPTLIRIETRAGHGAGTPVSKSIEQYADLWAFLLHTLNERP